MEEVYPELKTPGYSLEIYQALIRQLEFLNTRSPTTAVVPPAMHEAPRSAMTPENFCYWLQGRAELVAGAPTEAEWAAIVAHLALVFNKVTPYQGPWPMPMQPGPAPYSPFTPIC